MAINIQDIWASYNEATYNYEDYIEQIRRAEAKDMSNWRARMRSAGYDETSKAFKEGLANFSKKYAKMYEEAQQYNFTNDSAVRKFLTGESFKYKDKERSLDWWRREINEGLSKKKSYFLHAIDEVKFVNKEGRRIQHYLNYYTDFYRYHINEPFYQKDWVYRGANFRPIEVKARTPLSMEQYYSVMLGEYAAKPSVIKAEADILAEQRVKEAQQKTPGGPGSIGLRTVPIEVEDQIETEEETWWK